MPTIIAATTNRRMRELLNPSLQLQSALIIAC